MSEIRVGEPVTLEGTPVGGAPPRISIVIPTRNEAGNLGPLREALGRAMAGIDHEVIVVDDSTDGLTQAELRSLATAEPAWRIVERLPAEQTGLASAVALGIALARGKAVCVMDADLQHPPEVVLSLLREVESGADLAVASRYAPGGSGEGLAGHGRRLFSRGATWAALGLFPESRRTADPLSGFFCVRRTAIAGLAFRPVGFKILLELLVLCPELRVVDVPYVFGPRRQGVSKAGVRLGALFLRHLASLFVEVPRSSQPLKFALVTTLSLAIFLAGFAALSRTGMPLPAVWLLASAASSIANGLLQRRLTFGRRDPAIGIYRALGASGSAVGLGLYQLLGLIIGHRHPMILGTVAQTFALWLPLVLKLPNAHRLPIFGSARGVTLEDLGRLVRADAAWYATGLGLEEGAPPVTALGSRLDGLISQCATTQVPDLIIQSPSSRPQPRRNIQMVSAILVPTAPARVAVLVRYRRKPFQPEDLSQAIAWLYEHGPDAAAAPPMAPLGKTWSSLRRLSAFAVVGLSGIGVNQLVLWGLVEAAHLNYLLAAVLASVGSTTSNFVLTEVWVFRSPGAEGVQRRYLAFAALTAASTPIRLPILFVLTSVLGIHYLISNLVALSTVFGGRYLVSSLVIWGRRAGPLPRAATRAVTARRHRYDIDGLVTVASAVRMPELEFFRTAANMEADLVVDRGLVGGIWPSLGQRINADERHLLWREQTAGLGGNFRIDFGPPVRVTVAPLLGLSPHVVYTNLVEPLLRFLLVQRNRMLLHAATIVVNGETITLSAKTDTGKTGTILRLLQIHRGEFFSDDMVIVDASGLLSRYPKPLTLSAHTIPATPIHRIPTWRRWALPAQSRVHSRQGRAAGKWLGQRNLPIMSMNALVQAICPPPKYAVTDLVACEIGLKTRLRHVFVIDLGDPPEVRRLDLQAGVEELTRNTNDAYGFPPFASLLPYLRIGGSSCAELLRREQEILARALEGLSPWRIVARGYGWAAVIERQLGLETVPVPVGTR